MRTRNFIGRAFDCWRIQLEESKLNRIAKFPELWRMSHIADNDETVDEEDSVAKRPKHQHTGDAQGHVARWGAFETVSGSAENPEKKVFFKPIIPFFHAKGNERAALSSGSVGVRDILATGGAVRADIPQINAHPAGTRVMVDFAPMLALPPQVVEAKRVHMTTEVNWQHTGLGVAPADAAYISNEAAMSDDNHRTGLTESEHKKDFPTGLKASKANGLCETFVSPEVGHYTSIRVADITESAVSADQGPGLVWNSQLNEKEDVQNTLNTVAYNLHEESATTAVSSFRRAQSTEHSVVRSAASGASAEGANTSSSLRRSSLTMPTASSAIKAASGIAKRRASVSSEKRQKVEASNRINGDIIKSNSAVSPINAPMDASLFQMTTPDLFNDNILGSKTPEWLRQDTSSDGSGTPMLVHKVLNSPRYEQWAKRVAKVD